MGTTAGLVPSNEQARLAAVARYAILDTEREEVFDRLTALTARLLDTPGAMMSFVDADRVWIKSAQGVELREMPRDQSPCAVTITRDEPYLVPDASADPRWKDTQLVAGDLRLRFYAGAPLRTSDGFNLGGLCVVAPEARNVSASELRTLEDLAAVAMHQLDLRLAALGEPPAGEEFAETISWEDPPQRKVRPPEEWDSLLAQVSQRPGHWAKLRHYTGETSAYRAAAQLRDREDLPEGHWEFLARRSPEGGSDLFARVSAAEANDRNRRS